MEMQALSFYLPNGHCKSLVIYEEDVCCRVICVALLINADVLQAKTAEIEKRLIFIGCFYL